MLTSSEKSPRKVIKEATAEAVEEFCAEEELEIHLKGQTPGIGFEWHHCAIQISGTLLRDFHKGSGEFKEVPFCFVGLFIYFTFNQCYLG